MKTVNQVPIVELGGDIDGKTAGEIQEHILPQIETASKVLLDMSQVEYMSSAGLRMLLLLYRQMKKNDGRIVLVGLSEEIQDIMAVTGFLGHFTICATVDEGLKALEDSE